MFVSLALTVLASAAFTVTPPAPALDAPAARVQPAALAPTTLSAVAVTVECTARSDGRVRDCRVLDETHPGLGFGDAAIALVQGSQVAAPGHDVQFARTIQFMP